jgi:hypothetical protein
LKLFASATSSPLDVVESFQDIFLFRGESLPESFHLFGLQPLPSGSGFVFVDPALTPTIDFPRNPS